ncbi:aldehyde dehydrogenase [Enterococcus camelliae]|uniref:Aldehyde dehydrogenase n=1 Tax=Enterococcus camelliae TaxID=453959 RepID=A0ABW5TGV7_9ENTE
MTTIPTILDQQYAFFETAATRKLAFRLSQLTKLEQAIHTYEADLYAAFWQDLRKSEFEVYTTEIGFVLQSIRDTKKHLRRWMRPKKAKNPLFLLGSKSYSLFEPYGTVLIIGPFNYPFQLIIEPLIGALAAGNTAVIKPSELTPNVAAVIQKMLQHIFQEDYVAVVTGGVEETTALLAQRFDHLFFTGSPRVGKIVMRAASQYLIPVTLELGGKSPAIVTATTNLKEAAQKIAWGKFLNTGQTCVAPDYLLVDEQVVVAFTTELKKAVTAFYGEQPQTSPNYGRLATVRHTERLAALLEKTNGTIALGGQVTVDERYLAPTILTNVAWDDVVMEEELFGPILPILTYQAPHFDDQVLKPIRSREKPLALYLFTEDKPLIDIVTQQLSFGGGVINDTLLHLSNTHLPFGGVGESGMGNYHGIYSFQTFSHQKAIVKKNRFVPLSMLYAPYTKKKLALIKRIMK